MSTNADAQPANSNMSYRMIDEYYDQLINAADMFWANLVIFIEAEYTIRGKKWPSTKDGLLWAVREVSEIVEQVMARDGDWVRNNPQNHEPFSVGKFTEEEGDAIWMLCVIGLKEGVNPFRAMIEKGMAKINTVRYG